MAAKEHLWELKQALYEHPRASLMEDDPALGEFEQAEKKEIRFSMHLACGEDIQNLFIMTPFSHKTSPEDKAKIEKLDRLSVTAAFDLILYRKTGKP